MSTTRSAPTSGTVFTVQKALPVLNDGASVILAGSSTDIKGRRTFSTSAANNAPIRSFARSWAVEPVDHKIRVTVERARSEQHRQPSPLRPLDTTRKPAWQEELK